ncbi:MAG TPA: histidine kinase [Intrasporangium sp.]|nr:histidine kinase [Intrasporangium sp.]
MRGGEVARWGGVGMALAAAVVGAELMGVGSRHEPAAATSFSGTVAWTVALPVTVAATAAVATWNWSHGDRRLARWSLACAAATGIYALASSAMVWLPSQGGAGSAALAAAVTIVACGWTVVLALLQGAVLAAGESALGRPFGRRARGALLAAACVVVVVGLLLPPPMEAPDPAQVPTLLPPEVARSAFAQAATATVAAVWMVSTLALPTALWVLAARGRGPRRRLHVRLALGALLPPMVILLCGVLGVMLSAGAVGDAEMGALAAGFALAQPATLGWLTLTSRDARAVSRPAMTTVPAMVRVLLWSCYALAAFQIAAPIGGLLGSHPTHGALAALLVLALTLAPWALLVRWCVRRSDPRAAFDLAAREASAAGLPSGAVVEHAFREALASAEARLLLRRTPLRWTTADGSPADPPPSGEGTVDDLAVLRIDDEVGRTIGALLHGSRFVDTRSLTRIARPLVERAVLEADVHEQAELAAAERHRADAATHEARRRIERDLHDGVQGRLVSLGLGLSLAREGSADPVARELLGRTVAGIHEVVAELRELSSGSMSSRLTEQGLAAAVRELVRRMPLPVELDIPALDVPAPVEETAYFVIAEALANTVKHGAAGRAHVTVAVGTELVVRVLDDGMGGIDPRSGTGLRGLQERVHAVGGRLVVSDARPHGTLVEAVLPCVS